MSEKSVSKRVVGEEEGTNIPVPVVFTVDFLERTNVYLRVDGKNIAIPVASMRAACEFVLNETPEYDLKKVTDLYVQCSYPMREDAIAMSDCCRASATSVVYDGGDYLYRCNKHRGQTRGEKTGQAFTTVPVPRNVPLPVSTR